MVFREHGLGEGEFDILATLRRSGSPSTLTPSELAQQTMVTTGAVSKRLDRLETAGLISRRENESDARGRVITLTALGKNVIDRAYEAHMQNEARLLAHFTAAEREQLQALLRSWSLKLEQ